MKRRDIIKKISAEAKRQDDVYRLGSVMIPVPRHNEIGDRLSEAIFKQAEPELGRRWWR